MKLPSFKRLYKTDFQQEFQDLVDQMSLSLNNGIETLYDLGDKKISLRDNILCSVKDVDVIVNSDGNPITAAAISFDVSGVRVDGVELIKADNLTNSAIYPTAQPFISFQQKNDTILINNIKGLQVDYKWRLRVIIWHS